jgi:hypothetical protein
MITLTFLLVLFVIFTAWDISDHRY